MSLLAAIMAGNVRVGTLLGSTTADPIARAGLASEDRLDHLGLEIADRLLGPTTTHGIWKQLQEVAQEYLLNGGRSIRPRELVRLMSLRQFARHYLIGDSTKGALQRLPPAPETRYRSWLEHGGSLDELAGHIRGSSPGVVFALPARCVPRTMNADTLRDRAGIDHLGLRMRREVGWGARLEATCTVLRYRIPHSVPTRVPTFLDAGATNAPFAPTRTTRRVGWTRSLSSNSPGFPEVVHPPVVARDAVAQVCEQGTFSGDPSPAWRPQRLAEFTRRGNVRT